MAIYLVSGYNLYAYNKNEMFLENLKKAILDRDFNPNKKPSNNFIDASYFSKNIISDYTVYDIEAVRIDKILYDNNLFNKLLRMKEYDGYSNFLFKI